MRQGLPSQLQLNPTGIAYVNTPSSTNFACYRYRVRLIFPNKVSIETTALEGPFKAMSNVSSEEMFWREGVLIYVPQMP